MGIGTGKSVELSFDDGPEPAVALKTILATLKAKSILAEFFVIGAEVEKSPERAAEIAAGGHPIQNHSWSHPNLKKASESEVRDELSKTQKAIQKATGLTATVVRPPYGAGGWEPYDLELAKVAHELSLRIKNWDIDTNDWRSPKGIGAPKIADIQTQFEKQKAKSNFSVLMHVQPETARDLPGFLKQLEDWGFGFAKPKR
jgi:peptidoglycan/xylan/chitin deacetylase (PgdA/CDA1 family)